MRTTLKIFLAAAVLLITFTIQPIKASAVDNATFTKLFTAYGESVEEYIKAFTEKKWDKAVPVAKKIEGQSKELMQLAEKDSNKFWLFDVTNLFHHSQELVEEAGKKNAVESVYLIGTLIAHLGYIQSANPQWLKEEIGRQIAIIESGLAKKDQTTVRDAAEIVHTSANKIVLSSGMQKGLYLQDRWVEDIRKLNGIGDSIIEDVNGGNFDAPVAKIAEIKKAYEKWVKAFK